MAGPAGYGLQESEEVKAVLIIENSLEESMRVECVLDIAKVRESV